MKKLLITGASGFLGWYIAQATKLIWKVYGTYQQHPVTIDGLQTVSVNLCDRSAIQQLFADLQPDAVIHAAALSQPNACQENPELSYQINVLASWQIAEECAKRAIPCVFTSSEQVFDGSKAPYCESDPISPINLYGEHKAMAESGMLERHDRTAICRMPLMYGAAPTAISFIQPFIQRLRSGDLLQAFTDEIRMPLSGWDAAQGLLLALEKHQGILHLSGPEALSRYDMAKILVDVLALKEAKITPCKQADVNMAALRPKDLSMEHSLAQDLGFQPQDFRASITQIQEQLCHRS